jgi:hypothetical protein
MLTVSLGLMLAFRILSVGSRRIFERGLMLRPSPLQIEQPLLHLELVGAPLPPAMTCSSSKRPSWENIFAVANICLVYTWHNELGTS